MDYLGVRRESRQPARHTVVETHAQRDDQVAVLKGHVGRVAAVHSRHADEVRMRRGQRAEAHQRHHRRCVGQLDEFAQQAAGLRRDDAAARVYQRPLGLLQQLRRAPDLPRVPFREHLITRQVNRGHRLIVPLRLKNVFRNIHQHRPRPAAGRHVERLVYRLRQVFQPLHQVVVLGGGARDAERVGFLKRVAADQLGGHLAGDGHHRNRIHHRVYQAGHQVGRSRPGSRAAHAHPAGRPRPAFRRERRVLFVPHQHVADLVLVQHVVKRKRHAARISEHAIHAFLHQTLHQHLCARNQIRHTVPLNHW